MIMHLCETHKLDATHNDSGNWPNFVLNSQINPIGDQNDIQHLSIFPNIFSILSTHGTVPAYGTAYVLTYGTAYVSAREIYWPLSRKIVFKWCRLGAL